MTSLNMQRFGALSFAWPVATPTFGSHAVDAITDGVAIVFQAADTNPITHLGFRYGARTGTPPTYRISLQSPSISTGFPSGTVLGGGAPASATFTPPASAGWDGTFQWVALANSYTPARGERLCIVIEYSSGTIDGSNNSTFSTDVTNFGSASLNAHPYGARLTAGTWAFRFNGPPFGVRTASTRYGNPCQAAYNTRSAATVGHRQAMKFTLPVGMGSTFTVSGFRVNGDVAAAAGKNPIAGLWDATGVLQNVTLDSDIESFNNLSYGSREYFFDESSLTPLSFGTAYYVGLQVADAANSSVLINGLKLADAGDLAAFPGGSSFHFATFDGSAWTDDQTVRPFMELILDDITGGSGGGSGARNIFIGGGVA